jgi:hypothetical protein
MDISNFVRKSILLELMLTRKCCYFCEHCMYDCGPQESKAYMTDEILAKVKKQVDFLKKLDMFISVNLVGGEPTLNFKKFSHILDEVMTWNVSVTMTTNGWWLGSQKNIERFFAIISKYVHPDGKSCFYTGSKDGFNIRISDDPFHEKQRKVKDINGALLDIFSNDKLVKKYNIPIPNGTDPWLWRQFVNYGTDGFCSYYIAPNGRGRNVTNIGEWLNKFGKEGNFCMRNFNGFENIHYEPNGDISDACGYGSMYDFGTVNDNILYIIELIHMYKVERWNNRTTRNFTCANCRDMVKEWKKEKLELFKKSFAPLNTMNVEEFAASYSYIYENL